MYMLLPTNFHLIAELTNRCNLSCLHCFRTNNIADTPDLPLDLYEKFLHEALPYRSRHITLTGGGEPTLHQQFEAVLALTRRYAYTFTLVTNGWTFEHIYPVLAEYRRNVHTVVISLDGACEATHDKIRRQPGSYQKVIQAGMLCYYKQIPFRLSMVNHRLNIHEIKDFLALALKLGAEAAHLGSAQLTEALVSHHAALSPEERKTLHTTLLELEDNCAIEVHPVFDFYIDNPVFACQPLRMSSLTLNYRGHLRFCCQLSGYRDTGQDDDADILGDLRVTSTGDCHRKLVRLAAKFQEDKIQVVQQHGLTENEHFPCFYCAKYFHKLDWLKQFPDSEWSNDHT